VIAIARDSVLVGGSESTMYCSTLFASVCEYFRVLCLLPTFRANSQFKVF
jgi:hypothetical protein